MGSCVAYGCTHRPSMKIPGITFHRFPKDEERKQQWTNAVRRKDWFPTRYSTLCSVHFPENMIDRTSVACVRLRDNAVPSIFTEFPSYLQKLVTVPISSRESSNCELPLNEDSYQDTLLDGTFQNIDQQSIVSIKEEPISDSETEEIEKAKGKHDATKEIQSSFTIEKITVPNQWWAVSRTPKFILCAKWDASYACERKVIIEDNLNVKVFLKDHEIFDDNFKLSSLIEVSSLLCEVDRYYICPGIDKFKEKCLKYHKEKINGCRSVWCINCRNKQKAINYRLRKNPQLGLSQEERNKAKLEADKKYLKNILQQNRRLRKRVERLKNKVKILMHKDMTLDYDSTVKNIDVTSDIADIENDFDVENEMNMESDIDDVDNISSSISASEMISNVFHFTPDTDMVVNASRSTFDAKKDEIATHTGKVKYASIISSDSKKVGNTSQNQSVIFTSDIGKAQSVICNSSKSGKGKQTTHAISDTDIPGNLIQIAEIYITS